MWCWRTCSPRWLFLSSAKLPISDRAPTCVPGRRWLNGPMRDVVLDDRALDHARPDRQSGPIVESTTCDPVAIRVRSPTEVVPRSMTFGSSTTSWASVDGVVEVDGRRVEHRHPGAHPAVVELDPHVPLGPGELGAVVDPREAAVVVGVERRHDPPVLAGERDEVGEVQLAGRGEGRRSPIRRRSHAASIAYSPALISAICRSSSVASLSSTIRSTVPPSLRTTRPRPVGIQGVDGDQRDRRVVEAAQLEQRRQQVRLDERHVARQDEHLLDAVRQRLEGGAQGVARAARLVLEARCPRGPRPRRGRHRWPASRRRRAVRPVAPARRVEHVVDHRPAADRVEDLGHPGLHARAEAGREDDGDRAPDRRPGLEGVTRSGVREIASGSPRVGRLGRRPRS